MSTDFVDITHEERDLLIPYCECGCNGFWAKILGDGMFGLSSSPHCIRNDFVKEAVVKKLREKRKIAEEKQKK